MYTTYNCDLVSPKGSDSTGTGKLNKLNKLNNPYKTIQKGLNMASAGKTVFAFLENFLASYNVTWLDRATVYPTLPFSETTWL